MTLASRREPSPVCVPLGQGGEDADRGREPAEGHGERPPRTAAAPTRSSPITDNMPDCAEEAEVVARRLGVGAGGAEPGERAPHQARVLPAEVLVADAQRVEQAGALRLDEHVDRAGQGLQHLGGALALEVQPQRALAPG